MTKSQSKAAARKKRYTRSKKGRDTYARYLPVAREKASLYYKNNQQKARDASFERYCGVSRACADAMIAAQDGKCALCGQTPKSDWAPNARLHVDYCHDTGKVRAMLCPRCNRVLGMVRESPNLLRVMADYLDEHARSD